MVDVLGVLLVSVSRHAQCGAVRWMHSGSVHGQSRRDTIPHAANFQWQRPSVPQNFGAVVSAARGTLVEGCAQVGPRNAETASGAPTRGSQKGGGGRIYIDIEYTSLFENS